MKKRILGLDIVRCFAILFVPSVHFFGRTKFYSTPVTGVNMGFQLCLRWLFFICVPLFMLLTGYLQNQKTLSKKFYKGILPVLATYGVAAVGSVFFRIYYLKETLPPVQAIFSIFNFSAESYAWYVEMYLGLFLMIPFLNLAYHSLPSKKAKLVLLATSLFITSGTSLLSSFHIQEISINLFSDYWQICYPITYYFIGAYIKEFQPKMNRILNSALLILAVIAEAWVSKWIFIKNNHGLFDWNTFGGYGCIFTIIISVLFFLLFYQVDFTNRPIRFVIQELSVHSFDIYLFSFFFDYLFYPWFLDRFYQSQQQFLIWGIILVPLIVFCSYLVSKIKCLVFDGVKAVYHRICHKDHSFH